ncbi:IS607 family transposase [Gigaspora margarita]|uniref:IS607 family transposase n=1 Tax=Gigaspora margarita TaxID=4874 RepID=A0A8H3XEI0_GIGMA|nr:IS607 family transposase [Gigaspora margarita]
MESESAYYENSQIKERSNICPHLIANDSTLLKTFQDCLEITSNPNKRKSSVNHESAQTSKKRNLNNNARENPYLTANDSTLLKTFQDCLEITSNPNKRKSSVNHESARTSKKRNLNDNAREKVFYPFWTDTSKELSKKLWLPEGINYKGLPMSSLNGFFVNIR